MADKRQLLLVVLLIYLLAVAWSVFFSNLKLRSLAFHTRDYAYYLEFAAKLADGHLAPKQISLNPNGRTFFGFRATEGAGGFHRSVHFEPIKYLYALLYGLCGHPLVLFAFAAAVFFLPPLYLFLARFPENRWQLHGQLWFALLYSFYPSALTAASFDLRPYVFLAPFFALAILSVHFSRPYWETLLFFNLLFLAREEALLLAPVVIAYALFAEKSAGRTSLAALLGFFWAMWLLVICRYYYWSGCRIRTIKMVDLGVVIAGVLAAAAAGVWFWRYLRKKPHGRRLFRVLAYCLVLLPLGFHFLRMQFKQNFRTVPQDLIGNPQFTLLSAAVLLLIAFVWDLVPPRWHRKVTVFCGAIATLVFFFDMRIVSGIPGYVRKAHEASLVQQARSVTDPYWSRVLCDYTTHQAFCDCRYVYVFERLPWHVVPGAGRYYPRNAGILRRLIGEEIDTIVVSQPSEEAVRSLLAGLHVKTTEVATNGRYLVMRLQRDPPLPRGD